ncbi:sugar transferase [Aliifodinibius sp. S!AR15-10]|uniref:sugar transferase n=1 Tax=Aliifodinibius sp. S!AR15-10 TaxID=2950437 RepID=UPI002865D9C6|nr:sugar transferase [Aliifodinibius sp. S!AR15-10]MDR8390867.1 sugar transferase [Aliifodinibius sp. S!AR15-10]
MDFVSEKDQKGPTTDLFFHELIEKETRPKKYFELVVGFLGFLYFIITLPLYSLIIFVTSGRPIFETSQFVGYRGKKLTRYFYRIHKTSDPTQTTLVGKFLKITGLYKLPNFLNILNGSMGLVGPSPLSVNNSEHLNKKFTDFYKRFATKPGIIGIKNGNSWDLDQNAESLNHNLKLELKYLVYPTLKKDFQVISGNFEDRVLK